jgi:predicted GH43/DUF377 family glycosyl hydrolase
MRWVVVGICFALAGCGRYEDFSLPAPSKTVALDLNWKVRETPVMERGAALDVLNPSVVRWRNEYLNLYSVFDGKRWNTRVAASADGLAWTDRGEALNAGADYIAANGGVVEFGGELIYAYQMGVKGKTEIGLARSADGLKWVAGSRPILETGPRMSWDEISLGDPYLMVEGKTIYLFYLGEDRARIWFGGGNLPKPDERLNGQIGYAVLLKRD